MPIVSTGQITIVDVNDGLDVSLSANGVALAADTAGTVSSFAGAETTMLIREAGVNTTSTWSFYISATGGGISYRDSDDTVDRTGTGAINGQMTGTPGYVKVAALSQDLSYLDITAVKGTTTVVRRFSVAKARQGATGTRGTITTSAATAGTSWVDSEATAAISAAGGGSPIQGDVVTLYNTGASFSQTRVRSSGGTWSPLTAFFGGDVIVDNTLAASKIVAASISSDRIAAGAVTASKIAVGDFTVQARNWNFEEGDAGWDKQSGWTIVSDATNAKSGTWVARGVNTTPSAIRNLQKVSVEAGETFYAEAYIKHVSGAGTGTYLRCNIYNSAGAEIGYGTGNTIAAATTAYTKSSVSFAVPANAATLDIGLVSNITGGTAYVDEARLFRSSNTTLIADGAITTAKIGAGEVKAGNIFAGAVTTDKLDAGAVTAAKVSAGAITTSKLLVVPASICPDPYFADEAWWTSTLLDANGWFFESNTEINVSKQAALFSGAAIPPGTPRKHLWSGTVTAPAVGTVLRLRARVKNNSNHAIYVSARFYNGSGSTVGSDITLTSNANSGLQDLTAQGTVPAYAATIRFIIFNEAPGAAFSGAAQVSAVVLDVAASADLIVDGAISAAKISAGAITTDKLLVTGRGTALNDDPMFQDSSAWQLGPDTSFASNTTAAGAVANTYIGSSSGTDRISYSAKTFPIGPGKRYRLSANVYASTGNTRNLYLLVKFYDQNGNYVDSSVTGWGGTMSGYTYGGAPPVDVWTRVGSQFGAGTGRPIPGSVKSVQIGVWFNYSGGPGNSQVFQGCQDLRLEELVEADLIVDGAITATKLAANSIAVGTAAIENGAIVNAMIGNATITDAKIASLDASKITTGTLDANRIAANSITASQINSNGLSIKDTNGNIILAAGSPLAASNITPASGWLNSNISIDSTGNLNGIGGGIARLGRNLLNSARWVYNTSGGQTGFGENGTSSGGSNSIALTSTPDGTVGNVWVAVSGSASGTSGEGGWNTSLFFIDHTKPYRFTVWVRRVGANATGSYYLGCGANSVNDLGGGLNGNPYFLAQARSTLPDTVWCLAVGYVWPSSYSGVQTSAGGLYDSRTGARISASTDYRWTNGGESSNHRAYQYYTTGAGSRQDFFDPRVEVIDGTEPSIAELLATAAPSGRNQITSTTASTYIASAAIGDAQIANTIQSTNYSGSAGWQINKAGTATFNEVSLRGSINGGNYTEYAWPTTTGTGFHLGPSGLLLGNNNTGYGATGFFQIQSNGNLYAGAPGNTKFSVVDGTLYINELNVIGTAQVAGNAITSTSANYVNSQINDYPIVTDGSLQTYDIVSCVHNVAGPSSVILVSIYFHKLSPSTTAPTTGGIWNSVYGNSTAVGTFANVKLELLANSTVVETIWNLTNELTGTRSAAMQYSIYRVTGVAAGSTTFSLRLSVVRTSGTAGTRIWRVFTERVMIVQEIKR